MWEKCYAVVNQRMCRKCVATDAENLYSSTANNANIYSFFNLVMTTHTADGLEGRVDLIRLWETVGASAENNYEIVLAMYIWQKTPTMSFLCCLGVDALKSSSLW